ncbi:hypothetical protein GCM10027610_042650 [Dactylosporangium cerinum]
MVVADAAAAWDGSAEAEPVTSNAAAAAVNPKNTFMVVIRIRYSDVVGWDVDIKESLRNGTERSCTSTRSDCRRHHTDLCSWNLPHRGAWQHPAQQRRRRVRRRPAMAHVTRCGVVPPRSAA